MQDRFFFEACSNSEYLFEEEDERTTKFYIPCADAMDEIEDGWKNLNGKEKENQDDGMRMKTHTQNPLKR